MTCSPPGNHCKTQTTLLNNVNQNNIIDTSSVFITIGLLKPVYSSQCFGFVLDSGPIQSMLSSCTARFKDSMLIRFAEDTRVVGLMDSNDKLTYRGRGPEKISQACSVQELFRSCSLRRASAVLKASYSLFMSDSSSCHRVNDVGALKQKEHGFWTDSSHKQ